MALSSSEVRQIVLDTEVAFAKAIRAGDTEFLGLNDLFDEAGLISGSGPPDDPCLAAAAELVRFGSWAQATLEHAETGDSFDEFYDTALELAQDVENCMSDCERRLHLAPSPRAGLGAVLKAKVGRE